MADHRVGIGAAAFQINQARLDRHGSRTEGINADCPRVVVSTVPHLREGFTAAAP